MNSERPVFSRRDALKTLGAGVALLGLGALSSRASAAEVAAASSTAVTPQPFTLPKLGYAYNALEPHIDAQTMELHHSKHHKTYIDNANKALADYSDLQKLSAEEILRSLGTIPEKIRTVLRNNVGGHVNHSFFWQVLGPGGAAAGAPGGELASAIGKDFGSFETLKNQFGDAALKRFGSGWAWIVAKGGKLSIVSTANQDSPISDGATPILAIDVWEHAYYLKYQNRRAEYIAAFWNVVNWSQVAANYASAMKG